MAGDDELAERIEVAAPPEQVYALVSDLPRMGRWSPECVRCDWVGGATAAAPGARFKGHNRIGWRRWTTKGEIVAADPGRELSFDITSVFGLPVARWTYTFTPTPSGGTEVVERWQDKRGTVMHTLGRLATGVKDRRDHNVEGMRKTLERVKVDVEAAA